MENIIFYGEMTIKYTSLYHFIVICDILNKINKQIKIIIKMEAGNDKNNG